MTLREAIKAIEDGLHTSLAIDGACAKKAKEAVEWLKERPEIIHCRECKHHHYDSEDIPYCDRIDYGYGWKEDDFCSRRERRE